MAGVKNITIARALDEDGSAPSERRIRATLAHECGHGLLHAHLFLLDPSQGGLFSDPPPAELPKVLCRDVPNLTAIHKHGYTGRWWEFQANQAIGAILLPKQLVRAALISLLVESGSFHGGRLMATRRNEAIEKLTEVFKVNPVVARIRLDELFPLSEEKQTHL